MERSEQKTRAEERVGGWWRRVALTAPDAIDPRTAARSLVSGDKYDVAHR
ncbi:hypothetical protein [Cellulomonas hominis]